MRNALVLLFCVLSVSFSLACKKQAVKITGATVQHWISGGPGAGQANVYSITTYINTTEEVKFTNLWIGKENVLFHTQLLNYQIQKKMAFGDSVLLVCTRLHQENDKTFIPQKLPKKYKGAALLECMIGGKLQYFVINYFEKLPDKIGV